jgi:hypothetical protein
MANIGSSYDANKNKFKAPQPFESWTLNEETLLWEAPVAKPEGATFGVNQIKSGLFQNKIRLTRISS